MEYKWLLFCPQLPAVPSSPRVMVWRRMRSAGSLGLDNGLWILPYNDAAEQFVREMQAYVESQGGNSKTFTANALDEITDAEIIERFRQDRAEEISNSRSSATTFWRRSKKKPNGKTSASQSTRKTNRIWINQNLVVKVRQRDFIGGRHRLKRQIVAGKCQQALNALQPSL
jgi:hypothetical protein